MLLFGNFAQAYYTVMDNAEVLPKGVYKATGELQFITDRGGMNLASRFDAGVSEEIGLRGLFGFGTTDIFFGGLVKWIPFPDIDGQPAIGMNAGLLYARDDENRDLTIRLEPLVSKEFELGNFWLTPYASLPVGIRVRNSDVAKDSTDLTFQIAAGSQLQVEKWKNLQFMAEIGFDIDKAYSYVSGSVVYYFDEEKGLVVE